MHKHLNLYIAAAILALAPTACGNDDEYETSVDYASTQVKSFNLLANNKILNNLDSVYFSIDLVNARIFNADSLPFGTQINKLQVNISTDNCSAVEIRFPKPDQKGDSIINYLENTTDSIDFSRGNVRLHVVSLDKVAWRDYSIEVNVHKTVADSLLWFTDDLIGIPTSLAAPVEAATANMNRDLYTLTADASGRYCLNIASSPLETGENRTVTFPFTPAIETFTATTATFYILADTGDLYSSPDAVNWSSCGVNWVSITAPYGNQLLGITKEGDAYKHASYPGSSLLPAADDFPIAGNSQAIGFTSKWSPVAQIITLGGTKADGTPSPTVWAYDGTAWAKIADNTPMKVTGATMFPYYVCETDTNTWVATTRSVFVAIGGMESDKKINGTTYISYDLGFNWHTAPELMQAPKNFPALYGSRAYIYNKAMPSRAVRPITEWDTPYIYLYGGHNNAGDLYPHILRGVVNKLQFKPLQ